MKPSQDLSMSFKYSFTASEPKTSMYKSVNPPMDIKQIPQYPITQIPKEQFGRKIETEKIGEYNGQANLDFLKKIDEQLRISQQNYR